jgi:hypothetical protein
MGEAELSPFSFPHYFVVPLDGAGSAGCSPSTPRRMIGKFIPAARPVQLVIVEEPFHSPNDFLQHHGVTVWSLLAGQRDEEQRQRRTPGSMLTANERIHACLRYMTLPGYC